MKKNIVCSVAVVFLSMCLLLSGCGGNSSYTSGSSGYTGTESSGGNNDSFRSSTSSTPSQRQQILPDPGTFLEAEGELIETGFRFDGLDTSFDLYSFYWPDGSSGSRTSSGWTRYLSTLEALGFTYEEDIDAEGIPFYYIYGEDGVALLPWLESEFGTRIELYVPSGMAFTLGGDVVIDSSEASGGGTGSSSETDRVPVSGQGQQILPDPGILLQVDGELVESGYQIDGVDATFDVYTYSWSLVGTSPGNTRWDLYLASLESRDFTYIEEDSDTDGIILYYIYGEDGTALAARISSGHTVTIELYVPDGMAFVLGETQESSNGSGLLSGSGSFQNGSYTEGMKEPIVVDGETICTACGGNGICSYCHGIGVVKYDLKNYETCVICDGNGQCNICDGTGRWD